MKRKAKSKATRSVCAIVDSEHYEMLKSVLARSKRSIKGQIELWIEQEKRLLDISEVQR